MSTDALARGAGVCQHTWAATAPLAGAAPSTAQMAMSGRAGEDRRAVGRWAHRLVVFDSTQNNFLKLYYDSCNISMHLKILIKIAEFLCSHFNIEGG